MRILQLSFMWVYADPEPQLGMHYYFRWILATRYHTVETTKISHKNYLFEDIFEDLHNCDNTFQRESQLLISEHTLIPIGRAIFKCFWNLNTP
jgi:hypothetical protein